MAVGYYLIPITEPPYSKANPQKPQYVDEIQCNWSGHPVPDLGVYVCMVNTTEAKHTDLASRQGVRQLPRNYTWSTVISTMPAVARNAISNWCNNKGIPYDSSETLGEFLERVVNSGLFSFGSTALNTQFQNLSQAQKDKLTAACQKWGWEAPGATETVRQVTNRLGRFTWPGDDTTKIWVGEF